jgi:hypothetical protein
MNFDCKVEVISLHAFGHLRIVDPAITVAGDFPTELFHCRHRRRIALQRHCHRIDGNRQGARRECPIEPPKSGAAAVFESDLSPAASHSNFYRQVIHCAGMPRWPMLGSCNSLHATASRGTLHRNGQPFSISFLSVSTSPSRKHTTTSRCCSHHGAIRPIAAVSPIYGRRIASRMPGLPVMRAIRESCFAPQPMRSKTLWWRLVNNGRILVAQSP